MINESTLYAIIITLGVILFITGFVLYIYSGICRELSSENNDLIEENEVLEAELKFQKDLNKTFSKGLDALSPKFKKD